MTEPSLSVVIPSFNRGGLIGRALKSVLSEINHGDEIIVVDDGSTDNTVEIIEALSDHRIRYIRQANAGAGAARNRGAAEAGNELLAYLDSDDEWLPGKTEAQRTFMAAHPNVLFSFTDFGRMWCNGWEPNAIRQWHTDPRPWNEIMKGQLGTFESGSKAIDWYSGNIFLGEMYTNYILTSSIMIRREAAGDAIHFSEETRIFEDWECFGHLAKKGTAAFLNFEGAIQHAHPGARLTDAGLLTCAESRLSVLESVWGSSTGFLAEHASEYLQLVKQIQLDRIRGLLVSGRTADAKQSAKELGKIPLHYQALSRMPGSVVCSLLGLRRSIMGFTSLDSRPLNRTRA